jgi:hypothetical protein
MCPTITGERTIVAANTNIPMIGLGTDFIRWSEFGLPVDFHEAMPLRFQRSQWLEAVARQ